MRKQKFIIRRSKEGTVFEIVFIVLAIVAWAFIIHLFNIAPDMIPTHLGFAGNPDTYGDKHHMLFPCIISTVMGICCVAGAYFPHTVNIPGIKIVNISQAELVVRMMRVFALIMMVLTVGIALDAYYGNFLFTLATLLALIATSIIFIVLIWRQRERGTTHERK